MILKLPAALLAQYCIALAQVDHLRRGKNGRTGVEKFQKLKPDVVLLDLSMPHMINVEAEQQMTTANPSVSLILFTIVMTKEIGNAGREAGIRTIVPKSNT